ncbi:hypothetical protein [Paenarthrobacter sp. NPDC058040]|uniref:hypothetical protein n=1 Tax=unclassified Paenarthrobacter TaxID=2634190 RepID=UPI0036DDDC0A
MESPVDVLSAQAASVAELTAKIQRTHGFELRDFLTGMVSESGPLNPGRRQYRFGPTAAMEDRTVKLTMVAETAEFGWFTLGRAPAGTCLTLSVVAHHEESGLPAKLSTAECEAWTRALFGNSWMQHVYNCECDAGPTGANVVSYRVYLDAQQRPGPKPVEVMAEGCQPAGW